MERVEKNKRTVSQMKQLEQISFRIELCTILFEWN